MAEQPSPEKKFQLNALDGLRGVAVFIVFLSHTSNLDIFLLPLMDFSGIGKSGVFLFFILSSFLLTYPFIRKGHEAATPNFLANYGLRRFLRIYPVYFLYLLLGLITTSLMAKIVPSDSPIGIPFELNVQEFIAHLFLLQGKEVTWSILVEFRYYFVLPLLALMYALVLKNHLGLSIIVTLILIFLSQIFWPQGTSLENDPRLGPHLCVFFMGSLLAVVYHNWQQKEWFKHTSWVILLEIFGILALLILMLMIPSVASKILGRELAYNYNHQQFILFGFLWFVVVFACIAGYGFLRKFFETPLFRYLGFISFSMYLSHEVVVRLLSSRVTIPYFQGWLMLTITILISHVSWVLLEKPLSKIYITKSIFGKKEPQAP